MHRWIDRNILGLGASYGSPIDCGSGTLQVPGEYSHLGYLLIAQVVISFAVPLAAISLAKLSRFHGS